MENLGKLLELLQQQSPKIQEWIETYIPSKIPPLYNSVDIRYSGEKISVIDTNLFPGGFNNLNPLLRENAGKALLKQLNKYPFKINSVLLIVEDHTRNLAYLENIRSIEKIFESININFKTAAFFEDNPYVCEQHGFLEIAVNKENFKIYCIKNLIQQIEEQKESFDVIILNNDLSKGIPSDLEKFKIPVLPSKFAGWTKRTKSEHFSFYQNTIHKFVKDLSLDIDPWFLYPLQADCSNCLINEEKDRERLYQTARRLFVEVEEKYKEHSINGKPYLILKNNQGTYGMGVHPVFNAEDILSFNRKSRNKLSVGKGGTKITHLLLQEGIPTAQKFQSFSLETVSYQIGLDQIGMFYRYNTKKSSTDNLNSNGMQFTYDAGKLPFKGYTSLCSLLAKFATIAAIKEVEQLDMKPCP